MARNIILYSGEQTLLNNLKSLLSRYAISAVSPPVVQQKDPVLSEHMAKILTTLNAVNTNPKNGRVTDLSYFIDYNVGDDIKEILFAKIDKSITDLTNSYCSCYCNYCSCNCARCSCNCNRCSCNCDQCSCNGQGYDCSCNGQAGCSGNSCHCNFDSLYA